MEKNYMMISKKMLRKTFNSNGLWMDPKLQDKICETFEADLNETIKILKKDMTVKKRVKVRCSDYDEAYTKLRESHIVEFINGIMDRIKHGLDDYKDEVNTYYGSFKSMPESSGKEE